MVKMSRWSGREPHRFHPCAPARQHLGRRGDAPAALAVEAPAAGDPELHRVAQPLVVDAGAAVDGAQHGDGLVGGGPAVALGDAVEAGLHVAPVDGVEGAGEPVAEAHPEVLAVHLHCAGLSPGVGAEVVLECPGKSGHVPGLGALSGGVCARGDLAEEFLGHAQGLLGSDAAETSEGDALVGSGAAAGARAVVDDEGLGAGGLDPDAEACEAVVPGDPGPLVWLERLAFYVYSIAVLRMIVYKSVDHVFTTRRNRPDHAGKPPRRRSGDSPGEAGHP